MWGLIQGSHRRLFEPEVDPDRRHGSIGTVSMATTVIKGTRTRIAGSQFIITLTEEQSDQLDERATIFGYVVEGLDTLEKINNAYCDDQGRPLKDIRIKHTHILDDPFEDPPGLEVPPQSPEPSSVQLSTVRIGEGETLEEGGDEESKAKRKKEREARAQALTLEIVGDLPFADVKPQENVLFVCKLNPVTQDDDLELIFSRFGKILSCEIVRDKVTGDSLQYAFIEYEKKEDCERAYFKMEGVLIDDSRIHVDFSQSVARLRGEKNRSERSARERSANEKATSESRYREDRGDKRDHRRDDKYRDDGYRGDYRDNSYRGDYRDNRYRGDRRGDRCSDKYRYRDDKYHDDRLDDKYRHRDRDREPNNRDHRDYRERESSSHREDDTGRAQDYKRERGYRQTRDSHDDYKKRRH